MSIIPERYCWISGSTLKLIAIITMLIDHIAAVLLKNTNYVLLISGAYTLDLYRLMRSIGRISFPIYCFLLLEGFLHTHDRKQYGEKLLLFAFLSEIPWNLEHTGKIIAWDSRNVFFTLFLGLLAMYFLELFEDDWKRQIGSCLPLLCISVFLRADYRAIGLSFIIMLYLLRENRLAQTVLGCIMLPSRWLAGLAFIPIHFYNGKRGFIQGTWMKYAFYAFYPVHMMALYFIRRYTLGY